MTAKERKERAALEQRMLDMLAGRLGKTVAHIDLLPDCPGIAFEIGLEEWVDWVGALSFAFQASNGRDPEYGRMCPMYFGLHNIHHFGAAWPEVVDYLFENGARANAEPKTENTQ